MLGDFRKCYLIRLSKISGKDKCLKEKGFKRLAEANKSVSIVFDFIKYKYIL